MKNVLIICFEGVVKINNIPQSTCRYEIVDYARYLLSSKYRNGLTELYNLEYLVNDQIYERLEKNFGDFLETPNDFYDFEVEWDDIK